MTTPIALARELDRAAFHVAFRRRRTPQLYAATVAAIATVALTLTIAAGVLAVVL